MNLQLLSLTFFFVGACVASDLAYGNRPRGVSEQKASLYEEKEEFQCVDGSKSIPFDRVNDDYCDCADGSDEPGTSACPNGRFHCRNLGFKPLDLPSSRVNDFICDCCDGSDEWDSETNCPNVCEEIHKEVKIKADKYKELVTEGYAQRKALAEEGEKSMVEKKAEIEKLKKELEDLKPTEEVKRNEKDEAERLESEATKAEDDKWDAQVQEIRKADAAKFFKASANAEGTVTKEGFKHAVKEASQQELDDDRLNDLFGEEAITEEVLLNKIHDIRNYFKKAKAPEVTTDTPREEEEDDVLEPESVEEDVERKPAYTEETQKLVDAANVKRNEYDDVSSRVRQIESEISDSERYVGVEYGNDQAWAPLKGKCLDLNQNQYTYSLCLFDRAVQKEKNGYEIRLGSWKEWEGTDYNKQLYADGQTCWNGPPRSTKVHFECGLELELYDASEPNRCEYEFKVRAPTACPDPASLKDDYILHAEL